MSGAAAFIGPVIDLLFAGGEAYENNRRAGIYDDITNRALGTQTGLSQEMKRWGTEDWGRFKSKLSPAEESITRRAKEGVAPQLERATGDVNVETRMRSGGGFGAGNPGSGGSAARLAARGNKVASVTGVGVNRARTGERNRVDDFNWNNRMNVVRAGRGIPVSSATTFTRGQDILNLGSRRAAGLSDNYSSATIAGMYDVGRAAGNLTGQYGAYNRSQREAAGGDWDFNRTDNYGNTYADNTTDDYFDNQEAMFKADGGLIVGPGHGTSDSIPATVDGRAPARVSNGEYIIPKEAVAIIGRDRLDALRAKYHRPAGG